MPDLPNSTLVDVQHVTYTHWNQTEPTLHDVSLQIQPGTLNILVGPSGSGKSTLCDLFNGVIPHLHEGKFEGDVWVSGVNTRDAHVRDLAQQVGRVFQDAEVMFATLYVEDEIAFGPENLRVAPDEIRQTVERLLEQTDLTAHRHNLVWALSGGQIQKLGLAAVLATNPAMIVLDEPTSNLDPASTRSVHDLVLALRKEGITVLLVTRELDELLAEADQLLVMEDGRVLAAAPPEVVLREHGTYMVESLGVWLPETSEIGIKLMRAGLLPGSVVPITVDDTVEALAAGGLLDRLPGSAGVDTVLPNPEAGQPNPNPPETLIAARNLRYAYPDGTVALHEVTLNIHRGDWLMIVGRNGAGKSTLARLLIGLLKPQQSGELTLFGKDARTWKVETLSNQIALVFQNPEHQFLTDSVRDEIGYSLLAQGITEPEEVARRTVELLAQLGLEAVADVHPFALSAGLKRRLGVAVMLVGEPDLLVVDEPTYGQDREMTHTLMALMQQIRARGVGVIMITHDMRLVEEYAERVVVMSGGRILFDDTASNLFEQQTLLEEANLRRTILYDLLQAMQARGVTFNGEVRHTGDLLRRLRPDRVAE